MLNLGPIEIMVVLALALIVLGPRKLPEVARYLGKFYGLIRRTTWELKHTLDAELLEEDRERRREAAEARREEFRRKRLEKSEPLPDEQPQPKVGPTLEKASAPVEQESVEPAPSEPTS